MLPGGTVVDGVPMHAGKAGGTSASLLLRPERLSLSSTRIDNGLTVTIKDITFLGNNIEVSTQTGNGEILSVRLPFGHEAISGISRGDQAWLSFEPKSTHAFV